MVMGRSFQAVKSPATATTDALGRKNLNSTIPFVLTLVMV
jgi:hypothetical protein